MRAFAALALALVVAEPALAQRAAAPPPARLTPGLVAPNASTFTLANGLQVVVVPDRRLPVVTHMIWYRVGAADEPWGHSGIAHFLEHLMFKGTERFPAGSFSRRLASFGGQENAFTSWDYTAYFQRTTRDQLPLLMEFESDRMTNLRLTDEMVSAEREVVREERRQVVDNSPGAQLSEQMAAVLFQHHPYRIPIIGWDHEIRLLDREAAFAFYRRFYTPNNAVVVISGDVTEADVRPLAERTYGQVPVQVANITRVRPQEPPAIAPRRVALSHPRAQQPSWTRLYLAPAYGSHRDGTAEALDVLSEIMSGTTGRLYRALAIDRNIAAQAGAGYSGAAIDYGRFSLSVTPRPGVSFSDVDAAVDAVLAELIERGVTQDEVDRAINSSLASFIYAQDSMGYVARLLGLGLATGQSFDDVRNWPSRLARVTVEDVNRAARTYLDVRRSVTGTLSPAERRS
jgi:zinc protease